MTEDAKKKRVYLEREKADHTSHWDLDYLPWSEVEALYARKVPPVSDTVDKRRDGADIPMRRRVVVLAGLGALLLTAALVLYLLF